MQYPIYDMILDGDDTGLTAVSFVAEPAISKNFVYFRKHKEARPAFFAKQAAREVVSPLLIPNQLIRRIDERGDTYYIRWGAETIRQCMQRYLQNQYANRVTVEHPTESNPSLTYEDKGVLENDVYMLHLWIVGDNDIANTQYHFNVPKGTLMAHYKVHNRKLWNSIMDGTVKGLSIEANMRMARV